MAFIIVLLVLLAVTVVKCAYVVPQQSAYVIERLGRYSRVAYAGLNFKIPYVDRIATRTGLRVNQLDVRLETKTLDNVFVTVVASTQFRVNPDDVATAFYELHDPAGQLRSYMEDALRSAVPALTLDDAFARRMTWPPTCRGPSARRWAGSGSPSSRRSSPPSTQATR